MIELTKEQRSELQNPEPRAIDPETQETYVLVPQEVYERLREVVKQDAVVATGELLDRIMSDDDANDPTLASYQSITHEAKP
jgi:hypothetical protein